MAPDAGLQLLIGAALTDKEVLEVLLRDPLSLAGRFELTMPERRFLASVQARDLEHFATLVESWSSGEPSARRWLERTARLRIAG